MDLTKEFIEEHKLEQAQVKAISEVTTSHIADLKGEWDGKANKDAEAILEGAANKIAETTSVQRDKGEKIADFITRSWGTFSEKQSNELKNKITEYDEKIKNAGSDESIKKEIFFSLITLKSSKALIDKLCSPSLNDFIFFLDSPYSSQSLQSLRHLGDLSFQSRYSIKLTLSEIVKLNATLLSL